MTNRASALKATLEAHPRVCLIGPPASEPLATLEGIDLQHRLLLRASEHSAQEWSSVPDSIIRALERFDSFLLVGGVHAARALRKGLEVDAVVYLDNALGSRVPIQDGGAKQVNSIFAEWRRSHLTTPVISPDRVPFLHLPKG